ncbi:hypothetical protein ATI61_12323 [Archangium gephyra]|uniref:Uncharacterized protein n=1 Tax=Archangium gephyra TaxID=48 RepID=A0AAC8TIQ5_9BACT|nr:hypothetical protein [Archangium gephyra]AKJ07532.1 Hypothetical protein AA314_09158 [Archangium gephyra]REG19073.1 hypothetical protein ATI61_12323 [Archangium gephyra]
MACNKAIEPANFAITEDGYFMRVDGFLSMPKQATQETLGYGMIPCKSSTIFRCVPKKEMPAEYARANEKAAAGELPDNSERVYISHYDANGKSMLEPEWAEETQGALQTYAAEG